jgi:glucokinase
MKGNYIIGIEIGGTKLQVALGMRDGTILENRRGTVDRDKGAFGILAWISDRTREFLESADKPAEAIGIGFGGPVESLTGRALVSHQIAGWEDVPIRKWFSEKFNLPTVVANDANAAGWAEYCLGAGCRTRHFCYMNIGSGIGGALVIDGKLYDGQGRGAAEIGHTWVPDWTRTTSGAVDKLENLCSGWAIERRLRAMNNVPHGTPLYDLCVGDAQQITCPMLAEAARQQDAMACAEIDAIANAVAIALGNVVTLFHPECIALGGGVALMGDILLQPLREKLAHYAFGPYRDTIRIVPCALEENVVIAGALLLAADLKNQR